jgi:hypothetical protein
MEEYETIEKLKNELERVKSENDGWVASATQFFNNQQYYRGLLEEIGLMFGKEAFIQDDGGVCKSVLVAKVPEIVKRHLKIEVWKNLK